ncbi:sigma-54-dependent Fis family transcriptional regulator [candidate division KSB1 bacterium]|nr:sigma-54-dependent Fis family transcriptional regulator [candidate division KSB1 bacterium]
MTPDKPEILIIDDDANFVSDLTFLLEDSFDCEGVFDAQTGLECALSNAFDCILLDIELNDHLDGFDILKKMKQKSASTPVVMITGNDSLRTVVQAMQYGARDYIHKDSNRNEWKTILFKVLNAAGASCPEPASGTALEQILIGESRVMQHLRSQIQKLARVDTCVLTTGESGTGKELVADCIHRLSARKREPFVCINCAAIPKDLFESELFGHERGAFTGAHKRRYGKFELADRGILFLDEIAEIDVSVQAKLLRVLEEERFYRVGGETRVPTECRIIAATNADLDTSLRSGTFREDLYYRLSVSPIHIPPLRERREDIPILARAFLGQFNIKYKTNIKDFSDRAMALLLSCHWHGNVRQLKHAIEHAVIQSEGDRINESVFAQLRQDALTDSDYETAKQDVLNRFKQDYVKAILNETNGNISRAAERMGITRFGLQKMLKQFEIDPSGS